MVQDYSKNLIYGNFLGMENSAFPIDCETLATLQSNAKKFAATALIAGCERLILTGCQQSGTVRKEGYVFFVNPDNPLTGEVLFHPEQPAKDHCHVKENPVDVTADGTDYPAAYTERYLEEGLVEGAWLWSSFTRIDDISNAALKDSLNTVNNALDQKIESLKNNAQYTFVRGMILMWSGAITQIPDGWALCDGKNGTPNLSGRFVMGIGGGYDQEGGHASQSVTLTADNLPKHSHKFTTARGEGKHYHLFDDYFYPEHTVKPSYHAESHPYSTKIGSGDTDDDNDQVLTYRHSTEYDDGHTHTGTTDEAGGDKSFTIDTIPPYYALAYIMKL